MRNQQNLGFTKTQTTNGPVECLGTTFESDDARRAHFVGLLRDKLQDPEFRKAPGFPTGSDDAILRMSDPPYYTACPNPFLGEFVRDKGRPYEPSVKYERVPFALDVKEGRHDPIGLAHTYHAKVPWRAVLPYIMAYTSPGDIIYDGFAGTGMIAIACQMAKDPPKDVQIPVLSEKGPRRAVVSDLSPFASFLSASLNHPIASSEFGRHAHEILDQARDSVGHLYRTIDNNESCDVKYYVWSDVFGCSSCGFESTYYNFAYNASTKTYSDNFTCPSCSASLKKSDLERRFETRIDPLLGIPVRRAATELVLRSFTGINSKRRHIAPSQSDHELLLEASRTAAPRTVPIEEIPYMHMTHERNNLESIGVTHFHHFFTHRNLVTIGTIVDLILARPQPISRALMFWLTSCIPKLSKLMNYNADGIGRVTKGIFYFASVYQEFSPFAMLERAIVDIEKALDALEKADGDVFVSTHAAQASPLPDNSVDYVFTDPPFGENIYYSDLNYLWERWIGVRTCVKSEAIVNRSRQSSTTLGDYAHVMTEAFRDYFRVLKPGRWITVEFHNSSNAVWRAIQEGLGLAGFVIADVRVLDKKLKTFKQIVAASTMKQDLVISAYKPTEGLTHSFELGHATAEGAWDFVKEHLANVPVFVGRASEGEVVSERTAQMLLDRMIAFHVQRGITVPLSGPEFLQGLAQRFPERDGMYFLPDQVTEYDRRRTSVSELRQISLFVNDEASAIQWVRQQLQDKPQSFQDLQPQFMRELKAWAKHEKTVELKTILEQSFLYCDGRSAVPSQIHRYLSTNYKELRNLEKDDPRLVEKARDRWYVPDPSKQAEREAIREKSLLREFDEYKTSTQRKLKVFRTEAMRVGFKACWQESDYGTIVKVAEKLPDAVLQEDEKLLMYYDNALTRLGDE